MKHCFIALALLVVVPTWADSADIEVLRCENTAGFVFSLVSTDTGDLVKVTDKSGRGNFASRIDSKGKMDFVNHVLRVNTLIFVFDDAKDPKKLTVARPATSPLSGQVAVCDVKDPKRYAALFQIGTLSIPTDLYGGLFAGDLTSVRFFDTKAASGDYNCDYSYLGEPKKNCQWNYKDRLVTVNFESNGKVRTHLFMADPDVKSLVSRSATLSR
jgi:hypothetical protein